MPGYEAVGVVGQIIPWNFPLLMLAWKIAPGAGDGQHRRPEARRATRPSPRCCSRRCARRSGLPPGVVNIITGGGKSASARQPPRLSTRSPSPARPSRAHHPQGDSGQRQAPLARTGRQVAVRRLRRCRSGQRGRRRGRCDLVQPGAGLLRRVAAAGAGEHRRAPDRQAAARAWNACASATRWTRRWTSARLSRPCSSARSRDWSSRASSEGATSAGSRRGPARPRAASTRPPCSPTSRPPRPSRRWKFSAPCWWR